MVSMSELRNLILTMMIKYRICLIGANTSYPAMKIHS